MRNFLVGIMVLLGGAAAASAEDATAIPDLKGVWSGPFKTVIFGHNPHHPGAETTSSPPRVREITFTLEFEGQDGRLLWGKSWSDPAKKEPFAATITADGKTIVGADTDGAYSSTITAPGRMDLCYTQTALGPQQAIIASCGVIEQAK